MIAAVLREKGVADGAITLIPDEQQAIADALRMGQSGDLLLVFADALTRSWKQVTKFKPETSTTGTGGTASVGGAALREAVAPRTHVAEVAGAAVKLATQDDGALQAAGFVRDERGLRFVGKSND